MAITKPTLKQSYGGKTDNVDVFSAALWDNTLNAIDGKMGEIIDSLNTQALGPTEPVVVPSFYVNGVKKTAVNGKIQLDAFGGTGYPEGGYVLRGTLTGQIVIGASTDVPTDDTCIDLSGVKITTASTDNAAIMYMPEKQSMRITLLPNTENILVCSNVAEIADSQKGCLWSENNLVVQGTGYLACKNLGGHGIKASKLSFRGNPHCYAHASHDAFHGNANIDIFGGTYYVAKANDAFGTRAESGTVGSEDYKAPGNIRVFSGSIYAYGVSQVVLDSKADGYIFGKFSIQTNVSASNRMSNKMKIIDPAVFFGGAVQDNENGGYLTELNGSVKCYSDSAMTTGEVQIDLIDGKYTLTTKYAKVSGYIDGNIIAPTKSTDIKVGGHTYINGNISYTNSEKKVCIKNPKDLNYILIVKGNYTSASNLSVESAAGAVTIIDGNVSGDELTFADTKGLVLVTGNVTGKDVYIGCGAAKAEDTNKINASNGGYIFTNVPLVGTLIIEGTLKTILNSKFNKGWLTVLASKTTGFVVVDTLDIAGFADLDGSTHVSYHKAFGCVIGTKTVEDKDYITT